VTQAEQVVAIEQLAKAFTALGWTNRLGALRDFYASVRDGNGPTELWNESHLVWWLRALQLSTNCMPVLQRSSACPKCGGADGNLKRTRAALDERYVFICDCGADWVEMAER
jgi:hypothetical protein